MTLLLLLPTILSFLVLAVHYLRQGNYLLVGLCLVMPVLLLFRQRYILRSIQFLLILAFVEWLFTAYDLIQQRMADRQPFLRLAAILGGVGAFALLSALLLQTRRAKARFPIGGPSQHAAPSGFPVNSPQNPKQP